MVFEIRNKVALVTGGASGIGLCLGKELLRNGVKGLTLADINTAKGEKAAIELNQEFGPNKVIFVKTDVSDKSSFENAFNVTLKHFENIDILCNNAGVFNEVNWERTVDINVKGIINGILLGQENYLKTYKQDQEAVIINTASLAAVSPGIAMPIYTATKFATFGLTKCWGHWVHYDTSKVRIVAILPGYTDTAILKEPEEGIVTVRNGIEKVVDDTQALFGIQSPEFVAVETMKIIERGLNGSTWIIEENKPSYEYFLAEKNSFEQNVLK